MNSKNKTLNINNKDIINILLLYWISLKKKIKGKEKKSMYVGLDKETRKNKNIMTKINRLNTWVFIIFLSSRVPKINIANKLIEKSIPSWEKEADNFKTVGKENNAKINSLPLFINFSVKNTTPIQKIALNILPK